MASPVTWEAPARELGSENNAAFVEMHALLQSLHDHGVLDALRGAVGARDEILGKVVEAANAPESVRALRNLILLGQFAGSIEPEDLRSFLTLATRRPETPIGFWALFKRMRGVDFRRGLAAIVDTVEGFGRLK